MIKLIQENYDNLVHLCARYNVKNLEVFGSVTDESRFNVSGSDIDFIVEFLPLEPAVHARNYFGLLRGLHDLFKRDIDLVENRAIKNPYFLESINKNRQQIYAA